MRLESPIDTPDRPADWLVELDDDVLPGPPGHRRGPAVQVVGFGVVVDPHLVADPQAGQGPHRPGGGQQPHPLVDDRAEHVELLVQLPAGDRLDHDLDQVDRGGRGAGRLRLWAAGAAGHTWGVYAAAGHGGAGSQACPWNSCQSTTSGLMPCLRAVDR